MDEYFYTVFLDCPARFDQCTEKLRKFLQNLNTAFLSSYGNDWLWRVQKGGKFFRKFALAYVILVKFFLLWLMRCQSQCGGGFC